MSGSRRRTPRTPAAHRVPDIQLLFIAAPLFEARPYLAPFSQPFADGFACRLVVLRPESRGRISLASADPRVSPRIEQSLLATERDWNSIRKGIRLFRELASESVLQPFIKAEIGPGPAATSDEAIDAHIRATAVTAHHPAGTCRMGTMPWRWSIPSCACVERKGFASWMRQCFPTSSAAPSMRRWS
jgi:4-pyridoxate dehydrogenase